ncbi:tyrosine-type recombinase/integrase [Mucilaginibacter agri]|uniref:Tyrosine-type recombinase/integrase n=1 Tax=Mucilaginibacter agri TaxID=2695265 RepID=A0A966DS50_9SPHI|nr:tyrosine-type recombinase/integrase [Mucilaginibacter agri]NCD67882.1 tyrosine-type recombinase/integrase [Mucilaginibacter agri]
MKNNKSVGVLFEQALNKKFESSISKKYKDNLRQVYNHFMEFLGSEAYSTPLKKLKTSQIEEFLKRYNSSATHYMNKRRDLNVLFNTACKSIDVNLQSVKRTESRRIKATLNLAYEKEQLKPVLEYLKGSHTNLYRCCLITYGCLLRSHEEIRLLTKKHFKANNTEIHLAGNENKGGRVRVVYVPDYVRQELDPVLDEIKRDDNIFSGKLRPFNNSYFTKQWNRERIKLLSHGVIYPKQTLYSFRHTAAIDIFRRTKDVYMVQKMMGHSSVVVTLKYLRSLGEFNSEELEAAAPKLW